MNVNLMKNKRIEKNLTQEQLGAIVGVSGAYIQQIEKGVKTNPSLDVLHKIASALGVLTRDLIGFTESEQEAVRLLNDLHAKNPNDKILSDLLKKVTESGYLTKEDMKTIQDYDNWRFKYEIIGAPWAGVPKKETQAYQLFGAFLESLGYVGNKWQKRRGYLYMKCKTQLEVEGDYLERQIIKINGVEGEN
jgi:transcriptional regulator with XRE-family HTH domain